MTTTQSPHPATTANDRAVEMIDTEGKRHQPEACPVTGRSASVCLDQTHVGCWPGRLASVALDLKVARQLAKQEFGR